MLYITRVNGRRYQAAALASIAVIALVGVATLRAVKARRARHEADCRAQTKALDKSVREKTPRIYEGIAEHRWDGEAKRCLASLEYHYRPCDAKARKKDPETCAGPDADIVIYSFLESGPRPLLMCRRTYATGEANCQETVFGVDGTMLTTRDVPPDQFPAIKAGMMGRP